MASVREPVLHPFDVQGRRHGCDEIPKSVSDFIDDPFRPLAGELCFAGGCPKDTAPFSEFPWADFLRRRIKRKQVEAEIDQALEQALRLAKSMDASCLPGWRGPVAR